MKRSLTVTVLFALTVGAGNPAYIPIWLGSEPLFYCIEPALEPLRPEILYGFWTWAGQAGVRYAETRDCNAPRTIAYRLGGGMPLSTLAIAAYPPMRLPEEQASDGHRPAGDVWLNDRIPWTSAPGLGQLALAVLTHETGHAFGMGHSEDPTDVMHPDIQLGRIALSARERQAVRCLYRGECK
jgi:hypothetical protein